MTGATAAVAAQPFDGLPDGLLVDGSWRASSSESTFIVEDPASGERLAAVADATPQDALAALDAAAAAQEGWAGTPVRTRADLLRRAHDAVIAAESRLARLITLEMGKPLAEARAEVVYGADFLLWFAEEAMRLEGVHAPHPRGAGRVLTERQAVGPCLLITPWNFPLAMATRKVGAALAAGCTALLKPAELTPLTSLYLGQLLLDVGLPAGVLNVLTTTRPAELTDAVLEDGRLRKVSFTGSTAVGRRLNAACGERLIRCSLELGGNAPLIVCDDADLDRAVEGALVAKLRNGGASCVAANRLFVHERCVAAFARRLTDRMAALRVGRGTDGNDIGPLISAGELAKVQGLVEDAVARGAHVLCGGGALPGPGYFMEPTVLTNVPRDAPIVEGEIFGPVAPLLSFSRDHEVVDSANATPYGLAAYVFTQDIDRAFRLAERLDTGMVAVNQGMVSNAAAPFGGVKASGLGREGGHEGLNAYLETKYLAIAAPHVPVAMASGR